MAKIDERFVPGGGGGGNRSPVAELSENYVGIE